MEKKFEEEKEENLHGLDFSSENDDVDDPQYQSLLKSGNEDNLNNVSDKGNSNSFEELYCSENDRFLVPVYIDKDDKVIFNGNGVIVGNYLITADHVVHHEDENGQITRTAFFEYMNNLINVVDKQIVYKGKEGVELWESSEHDDICVYRLNGVKGNFKLFEQLPNVSPLKSGLQLVMKPYRKDLKTCNGVKQERRECVVYKVLDNQSKKANCFSIKLNSDTIHNGYSGSALFRKNVVYGILIANKPIGFGDSGTVIKADYIKKCIEEGKVEE